MGTQPRIGTELHTMEKNANTTQFFYQNGKLITLKTGEQHRSIFRSADMPLAEQQAQSSYLLGTNAPGSVIYVQEKD